MFRWAGLVFIASAGCAVSSSVAVAPVVDSRGHAGVEARVGLEAASGSPDYRVRLALHGGAGHLADPGTYGLVGLEAALEVGRAPRWEVAVPGGLRATPDGLAFGGGLAGAVLWQVSEGPEHGGLSLGPRVFVEALSGPLSGDARALFGVGLVLRWTLSDTTMNRWH